MTDAGQAAQPFAFLLLGMLLVYVFAGAALTALAQHRDARRRQQYRDAMRAPSASARITITIVPRPKPYDWAEEPRDR